MEPAELQPEADEAAELQRQLAALKVVPGVLGVLAYDHNPPGAEVDLNKIGVRLKLKHAGRKILINSHFNAERQSLLACAIEAREKVIEIIGETVVADAEKEVDLAAAAASLPPPLVEMTEEEKEWLAAWFDEQSEPADTTLEQAAAALTAHRASSSTSSSSTTSGFAALTEAQVRTCSPPRRHCARRHTRTRPCSHTHTGAAARPALAGAAPSPGASTRAAKEHGSSHHIPKYICIS
jgi:hypothetical protein